jgi:hypothetical protein
MEKFSALKGILLVSAFITSVGIWIAHWTQALDVGLFSRDNYFVTQFLRLGDQKDTRK